MFTRCDDWKICGIVNGTFVNKWLSFRFRILRIWSWELRNISNFMHTFAEKMSVSSSALFGPHCPFKITEKEQFFSLDMVVTA